MDYIDILTLGTICFPQEFVSYGLSEELLAQLFEEALNTTQLVFKRL